MAYVSGPDPTCAFFACLSFHHSHFYVQPWVLSLQTMWGGQAWHHINRSEGRNRGEDVFSLPS